MALAGFCYYTLLVVLEILLCSGMKFPGLSFYRPA